MEESVLGLVMSEGPRPTAGLPLTAQHPLCHQQKMMMVMMMMWRTLMKLILKVHLALLVVLVEAELQAIISIGEMQMTLWILQIGIPQLMARSCCLLIVTLTLLHMSFSTETTSELPVVLKELSGRFSPIERRDSRIYVYEEETWEVKGRFSQAVKDKTPLQWEMNDGGKLVLNLLAVGVFFFILFHIYNLNHFQDDLVDENMNLKSASGSAAGSIYIKSSASGSAASSFVAPSDTAETGSKSAIQLGPMQKILIDTFKISAHLLEGKKTTDLRLTYAKYLAIQKMILDVGAMERAATWTHQKPTVGDIAEVFMSKSGYFHRLSQLFPKGVDGSEMEKWLEGGEDAPEDSDVWGGKKTHFRTFQAF